jgi:L-aspartate oxidase
MYRDAFLARSRESLERVREFIGSMELEKGRSSTLLEYLDSNRLLSTVEMAKSCIEAMDLRKESRGSHFREDYPEKDESIGALIRVRLENGEPKAAYMGGAE